MATEPSFQQLVDETFRGTFEIHIFVAPLNAPEPVLQVLWADRWPSTRLTPAQKFRDVCATRDKMKALYLYLVFSHLGPTGARIKSIARPLTVAQELCSQVAT